MGAVESPEDGAGDHALTSKTPWAFAIDADGQVVAEGHGVRLAEVAQAILGSRGRSDQAGSRLIPMLIGNRSR